MNVDHANDHGSFVKEVPIKMSNLCCEITLPTTPLKDIHDGTPAVKTMKMTKEEYQKYLEWKKINPNTPIKSR
jgi:ribonucleotide reductase alpha subunit